MESEWKRNWRKNPFGTFMAVILTFLIVYLAQSAVGPFASNSTILANMGRFWDGTRWMLLMFPMLLIMVVVGYLSDDQRSSRLNITVNVRNRLAAMRTKRALMDKLEDTEMEDES